MKVCISKESYKDKSMAKAAVSLAERKNYKDNTGIVVKAIKWNEVSISAKDFYNLVINGYSFTTGLYKDKLMKEASGNNKQMIRKKNSVGRYVWMPPFNNGYINNGWIKEDWWSGSYCVFADIDETKSTSIEDYCSNLPADFLPTFGFYSPNDKPESRRFKLVWVFDFPIIEVDLWKEISNTINNGLNKIEQIKDKCGTTITQISYGNQGGSGVYYGYTYDPSMFDYLKNNIKTDEEKEAEDNGIKINDEIKINQKLIDTLKRNFPLSNIKFVDYVEWIWRKEDEIDWVGCDKFSTGLMGLCKENYWELNYNFGVKIKDGGERRRKLFMRMCLRRLLKPSATPEEILLNAYRDREYIIDNSDGVVSVENLIRNVKCAFSYKLDEIEAMFKNTIETLKKESPSIVFKYYKDRNYKREQYNIIKGEFTQYLISKVYDSNKTDKENIDLFNKSMEEWGYKFRIIDRTVFWKYRKENEINKNNDRDSLIIEKHNEGLSLSKINDELVNNGFKSMARSGIKKVIDKYTNNPDLLNNIVKKEVEETKEEELKIDFSEYFKQWMVK